MNGKSNEQFDAANEAKEDANKNLDARNLPIETKACDVKRKKEILWLRSK